ncbi:mitochondrial ribosomal death-associated protein 3-domain-containing protein [Cercophora newfieldiana]|uniref:Small ribosomal subunit protein mS29 n=1 Tax=Cercophora newfieldiana TaxID=92897 RepID=A0AA40D0D2_9PEZI|nr:mitochondrial ribosomal death-associated protein 3-domain-containing protein [Cercophora newfieldiana]
MSAPNSLRCLLRPSAAVPRQIAAATWTPSPWIAPFSTTPGAGKAGTTPKKNVPKPKAAAPRGVGMNPTGKKQSMKKFKKAQGAKTAKPPLPGERKAMRKRIQLSNNNALPVEGLAELEPGTMLNPKNIGTMAALPGAMQDNLRSLEAFKATQFWPMFRQPATLIRSETVDLMNRMQSAASKKETLRLVVTGERITGKSLLLLQSMAYGLQNDWVVINIPEAQELTTACTEYAPIPDTDPVQYMQNNYCLKMIQAIRKANASVLSKITTAYSHPELPQNIPINSTLLALANAAKEPESAWVVFQALWKELMRKGAARPPVLFTLDGLPHIMKVSDYRSPAFELIHSQDLALVRLFSDVLSGATSLPNGGAVLAATTRGNAPRSPSMDLALAQREAEQAGTELPKPEPYFKGYDLRSEEVLKTVSVMKLKGLSKVEARGLMEYWAASGIFRATVDEKAVAAKWALSAGVVGEMERVNLLTMHP